MRLLVDENLSYRMVEQFEDAGHDAVHVNQVGLGDTDDVVIFAWAANDAASSSLRMPTLARCSG